VAVSERGARHGAAQGPGARRKTEADGDAYGYEEMGAARDAACARGCGERLELLPEPDIPGVSLWLTPGMSGSVKSTQALYLPVPTVTTCLFRQIVADNGAPEIGR
jgi:hypothetical protein